MRSVIACLILLSIPATTLGQAVVEHAVITGSTSVGTAAGAKGVGQSIGAVFGELNNKLDNATSSSSLDVRVRGTSKSSEAELLEAQQIRNARVVVEEIEDGVSASVLVEKFGKPQMMISSGDKSHVYHYTSTTGELVEVDLKDGTVTGVKLKRVEVSKRPDVVVIQ